MKITITEKEYNVGKNTLINFLSEMYDIDSTISDRKENILDKIETIKEFDDTLSKSVRINDKAIDLKIDSNNGIDIKIDEDLVDDIFTLLCNPALISIMRTINNAVSSLKSIVELTVRPALDSIKEKYLKNLKSNIKVTDNSSVGNKDRKDGKNNEDVDKKYYSGLEIPDEGVEMIKNASEISMEELEKLDKLEVDIKELKRLDDEDVE